MRKIQSVLFICTMNSVRSPIAEGLAKRRYGKKIYVDSAGIYKTDRDGFALAVLKEVGVDLSEEQSKKIDDVDYESFDLIVALSYEAYKKAKDYLSLNAVEVIYWPVEDVTGTGGSRENRLNAYRRVRDEIDKYILDEIAPHVE